MVANASTTIVHKVKLPTAGLLPPPTEKQLLKSLTVAMERFVRNGELDECLSHFPDQAHLLRPYLEFWAEFLELPVVRPAAAEEAAEPEPAALFYVANIVAGAVLVVLVVAGLAALAAG